MIDLSILYEPFTEASVATVGPWYLGAIVCVLALAYLHSWADIEFEISDVLDELSPVMVLVVVAVVAPVSEELLFRWLPMHLGLSTPLVITASVVWVLIHGKRSLIIAPLTPVFLKLALGGFIVEAIIVHAAHNALASLLYLYRR